MDAPKKDYVPNLTIFTLWGGVMIGIIVAIIVLLVLGLPQDWRTDEGLLDTGATLMPDLAVLAFVLLLVPGMIVGLVFARQKRFVPYHQVTMTTILLVNWGLIAFIMAASFGGVSDNDATRNIVRPHALFGVTAQIIGTIVVFRMWFEEFLPRSLRFGHIKFLMRTTLALWFITAAFGIATYVRLYDPFSDDSGSDVPVVTPEPTEEVEDMVDETPVPDAVETEEMEPVETEEVEPVETEEAPEPIETEEAEG